MKFEDILMQRDGEHRKRLDLEQERLDLEQEVAQLQQVLEKEQKMNQILQCAFHGPIVFCSCLSSSLPIKDILMLHLVMVMINVTLQGSILIHHLVDFTLIQELLVELAITEDEIVYLEREVEELKMCLYEERKPEKGGSLQQKQQQQLGQSLQRCFLCGLASERKLQELGQLPLLPITEFRSLSCAELCEDEADCLRRRDNHKQNQSQVNDEISTESPNKLSEELMKTLISIFHKLNQTSTRVKYEPIISPKVTTSCMSSRNFMFKSSFSCKMPTSSSKNTTKMVDPYDILSDIDGKTRDIGSYKNFTHFTRSSLDMNRISLCLPSINKLRTLMHKLSTVELSSMTYKQKLAFWINIYNASIMHAFLQHGLPPSGKLLTLLNKAALNVGGIVLNALAIEHFILRHSTETQDQSIDEKEALLRHPYGLDYPEPNVTFALCRGSWSSPALRVYSADNVVNELEKSKVEYLDASIGIGSKKIFLPKLLHWHMRDFADDVESLLEWVYSQLPRTGSLKRSIMECLSRDTKIRLSKLVEIQHYEEEFRYLLPQISKNLTHEL